jgi:sulfoxide reductase heme-binding subunit YedZ
VKSLTQALHHFLNHPAGNQWPLFWLVSLPVSSVMALSMLRIEAWNGPAVSSLIQLSVRFAVPFLFLAFAASSLQALYPGPFTRWLLRNRKILGLCFAMSMAWQGTFILWLTTIYRDYYITEVYVLRDAIEGTIGYLFLAAMTFTSFQMGRRQLSARAWRYLHKAGIYFLWAYAYSVYWWEIFYYPDPEALDYLYFVMGFAAFVLRVAAWRSKQLKKLANTPPGRAVSALNQTAVAVLVFSGMALAATSALWLQAARNLFTGHTATHFADTYLPYWPFEPFFPLLLIALAAWFSVSGRERPGPSHGHTAK